jgi:dienelactone hydrolase
VVERVKYPTRAGMAEGDLYLPSSQGPHPAVVVCLGVVPFEVDHPQVPVLGRALARAGFAALLYWSPAMRDFRLDPEDVENIALAYGWLTRQPYVDPGRSGLLGTCVGGGFALMSAAHASVRDRVAFAAAYAPFSSMWTLARDIASATRTEGEAHEPWRVDQLTRKVFVHSLTSDLAPAEAQVFRAAFGAQGGTLDAQGLSEQGRRLLALMTAAGPAEAEAALHELPRELQQRLKALTLIDRLQDLKAPLIIVLHDRGDQVVPVGESRRLVQALDGRSGVQYTEMQFSHLDPSKGRLPLWKLLREFARFFRAMLPLFRQSVA